MCYNIIRLVLAPAPQVLVILPSGLANRNAHGGHYHSAEGVVAMYQHNVVQIRAKIRAAQRRTEQEAKRRMRELEQKLKQALRK